MCIPAVGNPVVARKRDLRRRKKKIPAQLISFDDELSRPEVPDIKSPLYHSAPTTCLSSPAPTTAGTTPYADRLNKLAQLQELQLAKEALKSASHSPCDQTDHSRVSQKMGNAADKAKSRDGVRSPLQDCDELDSNLCINEKNATYDDESLKEPTFQNLFENIFPKPLDHLPENSGGSVDDSSVAAGPIPLTKSQRPSSLYDQENGSQKSSQSNLSGDSFPLRYVMKLCNEFLLALLILTLLPWKLCMKLVM